MQTRDYLVGENICDNNVSLPKSDVLRYYLEDGLEVVVRPSGTEPKLKIYITAVGDSKLAGEQILDKISLYCENELIKEVI